MSETPTQIFDLHTFCDRMTCHGLKEIDISSSRLERTFWVALFIGAVCVLGFSAYVEVYEYVTNPILTTISVEPRDMMRFPQVYICPMSFINWDYVNVCSDKDILLNRSASLIPEFTSIFEGASSNWEKVAQILPPPQAAIRPGPEIVCPTVPRDETDAQFIKRHAFDADMIVRQCKMNGAMSDCRNMTRQILDKEYGVCYLVDVRLLAKSNQHSQGTPGLGMSLIIDVHANMVPGDPSMNYQPVVDGIKVRIDEHLDPADLTGTFIQPGTMTKLSLTAQKRKLISFSGSKTPQKCTEPDSYKLQVFNQSIDYSQQLCRTDCALAHMIRSCGCITPVDPQFIQNKLSKFTHSYCTREKFTSCVLQMNQSQLHRCTSKCHTACQSVEISGSSSQATFPSGGLKRRGDQYEDIPYFEPTFHTYGMRKPGPRYPMPDPAPPRTNDTQSMTESNASTSTTVKPARTPETMDNTSKIVGPLPPPPPPEPDIYNTTLDHDADQDNDYSFYFQVPPMPYQPISERGQLLITESGRMAQNIIMLDIAYDRLEYNILEQNPSRTPASLVSNIGGQAGLWTGASIFTFIQLFFYLCQLVMKKNTDRKNSTYNASIAVQQDIVHAKMKILTKKISATPLE